MKRFIQMSKKSKKMKNSAVLEVSLNPALDPPVIISDRDYDAKGQRIRWIRKDEVHEFDFKELNYLTQRYFYRQTIEPDGQILKCRNRAPENGDEYEYEIIVTWQGDDYTSTKSGAPPSDKPVIRN